MRVLILTIIDYNRKLATKIILFEAVNDAHRGIMVAAQHYYLPEIVHVAELVLRGH